MTICHCITRRCGDSGGREVDIKIWRQHQRDDYAASYRQQSTFQVPSDQAVDHLLAIENEILQATILDPPFPNDMMEETMEETINTLQFDIEMEEPDILQGNENNNLSSTFNLAYFEQLSGEEQQLKVTLENVHKIHLAVQEFSSKTLRLLSAPTLGQGLLRTPDNYPLNEHIEWFTNQQNSVKSFQGRSLSPLLESLIDMVLHNIADIMHRVHEHHNQWVFPGVHHFDTSELFKKKKREKITV
ncbi:hypothetical protein M422DRAFT_51827 [Sphaerobolus stellatus SS14]|uniref:Uncharacterized protein n=1 Tax=Sphaerobolus stellatus (strain SS14) TaxID=990650 RepID=A0A0C9VB77_SPHS4|nr:hypothetical protein M422DRAFT_51827 [Sphaerobolus stellatus SS14]